MRMGLYGFWSVAVASAVNSRSSRELKIIILILLFWCLDLQYRCLVNDVCAVSFYTFEHVPLRTCTRIRSSFQPVQDSAL